MPNSGTMFVAALVVLLVLASLSHPALRDRFRRALRPGQPDDLTLRIALSG